MFYSSAEIQDIKRMKAPLLLFKSLLPNRRASVVSEEDLNLYLPTVEIIPSKGRINAPAKTDGSLKHSESSKNLVNILKHEIQDGQLSFRGKRVLELNCGSGLAGSLATLKGACTVHFQDSSAETIRLKTIPYILSGQLRSDSSSVSSPSQSKSAASSSHQLKPETRFYAGEFEELHSVLSLVDLDLESRFSDDDDSMNREDSISSNNGLKRRSRKLSGSQAWERGNEIDAIIGGYDVILISDLNRSVKSLQILHVLVMKCLRPPYGIIYMAAKKNVVKQLKVFFDEEGLLGARLVAEIADREIWKFFFK